MTPVASASSAGVSCDAASSVTQAPCSRWLVPWHGDGSERLSATAAAGVIGRKARKRRSSNYCVWCSSASDAGRGGMGPGPLGRFLLRNNHLPFSVESRKEKEGEWLAPCFTG